MKKGIETVWKEFDGVDNVKTCSVSHLIGMQFICQRHVQWFLIPDQRSLQKNTCGCLYATLLWVFITQS